jgi:hypothetical protein
MTAQCLPLGVAEEEGGSTDVRRALGSRIDADSVELDLRCYLVEGIPDGTIRPGYVR